MPTVLRPLAVLLLFSAPISITGCNGFFLPQCQAQNNCTPTTTTTTTGTPSTCAPGTGTGTATGTTGITGTNGAGTCPPGTGTGTTGITGTNGTGTPPAASSTSPASYLYVADAAANRLMAYAVAPGQVTAIPTAAAPAPVAMAAASHGNLLYTADASGHILLSHIQSDGSLQPAASTAATLPGTVTLALDPQGAELFAATSSATLSTFAIDPATGQLSLQSSIALDSGRPGTILPVPDNRQLFISLGAGGVDTVLLDSGPSRFHLAPSSPGARDTALAVSGGILYVAENPAGIRAFSITPGGQPAEISGSPFAASPAVASLAVRGSRLYASDPAAGTLAIYSIVSGGRLAPVSTAPFSPAAISSDATGGTLLAVPTQNSAASKPQVISPSTPAGE